LPFTHTFGLGGMSLVLVGMLMATGVLLMLAYEPTPEAAYRSIESLEQNYLFGGLIRNIHHWSANLLVAVAPWRCCTCCEYWRPVATTDYAV